jgi:rod shape-determining protein MreD
MRLAKHHGGMVILITFIIALILTIMPLPEWLRYVRPDWAGLVLIYWCLALPDRVGVSTGWLTGLLVDLLTGTLLGQHALSLVRLYPIWQQALTVLVLLVVHQLLSLWINRIIGRSGAPWYVWIPAVSSMLIWPLVFPLLRGLRRGFRVN